MSPNKKTSRSVSFPTLILTTALLVGAAAAEAQTCAGALPTPGAKPVVGGDKFRLIAQACPGVAEPVTVQRAPQLDLYDRGSVTIQMSEPAEETNPPPAPAPRAPYAPPRTMAGAPDRDVARVMSITPAILAAARAYSLDPLLLHAIAHVESRHRAGAVSPAGARGVMQVMPATGRRFGVADEQSLLDPHTNIGASAAYIRTLRTRYGDDLRLVLAAYNAGEGAVEKYGRNIPPYPETQAYVRDVLGIYRRLSATFEVAPNGTLVSR